MIGCALYKRLKYQDYAKRILLGIMPVLKSLLTKRVALLKLYLLVSLKIGVWYQMLSSLEFNFHYQYSSHSLKNLFSCPENSEAGCYLLVTTVSAHECIFCLVERVRNESTGKKSGIQLGFKFQALLNTSHRHSYHLVWSPSWSAGEGSVTPSDCVRLQASSFIFRPRF